MKLAKLRVKARAIWGRRDRAGSIAQMRPRSIATMRTREDGVEVAVVRGREFTRPQCARKHWSDA